MSSRPELTILELRNIGFSYGSNGFAFRDLSFSVGEGEFIGLLGANGSGKSTILKLCCGILKPAAGRLILWGKPLHSYRNRDRAKLVGCDLACPWARRGWELGRDLRAGFSITLYIGSRPR